MKILHVVPHLGGGVGKAHASLTEARRPGLERTYALLEAPRDPTYVARVRAAGATLHVEPDPETLGALMRAADIVQIEWWNHPRLYGFLANTRLPPMRLVTWLHISGLSAPFIPVSLVQMSEKTLFTSACSFDAPNLKTVIAGRPHAFEAVNSGFGFPAATDRSAMRDLRLGYLGTVDFVKMDPRFFDFVDAAFDPIHVSIWGDHDPRGAVARRAAAMRHPDRVTFEGFTSDPKAALAEVDLFVYLLAPGHYGTAENALVEAMSTGAVPVVRDNPAETAIVQHGRTGFVVRTAEDFAGLIAWAGRHPERIREMGAAAAEEVRRHRGADASSAAFARIYRDVARRPKRQLDFAAVFGPDARTWCLSTFQAPGGAIEINAQFRSTLPSKGSPSHFRMCFPGDGSLSDAALGISAA